MLISSYFRGLGKSETWNDNPGLSLLRGAAMGRSIENGCMWPTEL